MHPLTSETNEAARRVQVIPAPIVSPGNCGICGKHEHKDGFADARLDFEWYGTFYLCADCVGEFARAFNYIDESQYQRLLDHIVTQGEMLEWYEKKFAKLEGVLGEPYSPINFSNGDTTDNSSNVSVADSEEGDGEVSAEPTESERTHFVVTPKQPSGTKPPLQLVSESGTDGVSGDTSDDTDPLGL